MTRNNCRRFRASYAISRRWYNSYRPRIFHVWRLTLTRHRLKKGRKVTSSRHYSCTARLTIGFCPRFSIRLYLACLQCLTDGQPFCTHIHTFSLSLSFLSFSFPSLYLLLHVFPLSSGASIFFNFYLALELPRPFPTSFPPSLSFSLTLSSSLSRIPRASIFFVNYFPPTLLISSSV